MTFLQLCLLLMPLLDSNVSGSHVRRRAIGIKLSIAEKKIYVDGPDPICIQHDVDQILAACDCAVNLDGVQWKDENEYVGCLIVQKTFSRCGLQRIIESSPCLPFPSAEPTTSVMPSTAMPSSDPSSTPSILPSSSALPSNSFIPSATPSQSMVPSVVPSSPQPSFAPPLSIAPTLEPSANPSTLPSLDPSGLETTIQQGLDAFFGEPQSSMAPSLEPSSLQPSFMPSSSFAPSMEPPLLELVGNNHLPLEAFPLGMCQGDCDVDRDCEGDLQCKIRAGLEPVPGCRGVGVSGKDYCADPTPKRPWSGRDPFYKFMVRLFYDPLYFWQETFDESWWCMECTRCENYTLDDGEDANCTIPGPSSASCLEDDNIWIMKCNRRGDFEYNVVKNLGSGDQIRVDSTNLCFSTFNNTFLELKTCNNTDTRQLWMPITNLSKFVLRPYEPSYPHLNNSLCLTQMHHPKAEGEFSTVV